MTSFVLPDFYMPWPARLNPNLAAARLHTKAWAYKMGILDPSPDDGPEIWSERKFDAMDYALLCAYGHPDTPGDELNLLCDWYVWLFFFDDHFLETYKQSQDMAGAKAYIARLSAFMPVSPQSTQLTPTNIVERGLVDLWARTTPGRSTDWQRRFANTTKNTLETVLWELTNISQQRIANPIEYIEMRRLVGGALWSADLVEHAVFAEVPASIVATRPIRVLQDTFADSVCLCNDIFSYQREIEEEGELANCVLVLEKFLEVDVQQAVNLTNELLTSRLQQFENTALTELPLLFEEYRLNPLERQQVWLYAKGLRDWLSGGHEWHMQTHRYGRSGAASSRSTSAGLFAPTGLGTSALRVKLSPGRLGLERRFKSHTHLPYQAVGPVTLPHFYMPFSTEMNPALGLARQHSKQWARQMGMLQPFVGFAGAVWDERTFDAADGALGCALCYPDLPAATLDLITAWVVWLTYVDDYFLKRYTQTRDLVGAKLFVARLLALLADDPAPTTVPLDAAERGLVDLWLRTAVTLSPSARHELRRVLTDLTEGWLWELANQLQHRLPDPIDYIEMRRKTFGAKLRLQVYRLPLLAELPPAIFRTPALLSLEHSAVDVATLTNDIFSYQKEIEFDGEINNGVLVVQHFLDYPLPRAVALVNELIAARLHQFEHIVETELPALCADFDLNENAYRKLRTYVKQLQRWMSGMLGWHQAVERYQQPTLRQRSSTGGLHSDCARPTAVAMPMGADYLVTQAILGTLPLLSSGRLTGLGTSAAWVGAAATAQPPEVAMPPIVSEKAEPASLLSRLTGVGTAAARNGAQTKAQSME